MEKLIITAAICGAEVTKEQNPAVPYTVEEIVREAKSAYDAGAAVVHIHVREDDGTPTQSRDRFKVCMDAVREACPDVILIPSTGGAVGMTAEERLQPTELFPEMATLDCGTCNFGDEVSKHHAHDACLWKENARKQYQTRVRMLRNGALGHHLTYGYQGRSSR